MKHSFELGIRVAKCSQIAANGLGLSRKVLHCSETTSLEDFVEGILIHTSQLPDRDRNGKRSSRLEENVGPNLVSHCSERYYVWNFMRCKSPFESFQLP